jgi:hypothetical protein
MGMILDGIGTSEAIDSSGELLELKGLDISDLVEGRGVLNTEHRGDDAPGYSYLDIIGRVIYAKKLYKRDDCENDRQRKYWDEVKLPYLYIKVELFDSAEDGDHAAAKAAAAMIRHYTRRGLNVLIRYSIEGSTLVMEDKTIKAAIARRVAATIKPANKTCNSGILEDSYEKPEKKGKDALGGADGIGGFLEDSEEVTKFEKPDAMKLGKSVLMACNPEVDAVDTFAEQATAFVDLAKTMEGGSYNAAPSTLTGGAALQREDLGQHQRLVTICKVALRDYDKDKHGPFRKHLQKMLEDEGMFEVSDEFLDTFEQLAEELPVSAKLNRLKKDEGEEAAPVKTKESPAEKRTRREGAYKETIATIKENRAAAFPPGTEDEAGRLPPTESPGWKPRAKPSTPRNGIVVDHARGVIYTGPTTRGPASGRRLYAPSVNDAHYMKHLTDPDINATHDRALKNWVLMHRLARQGKIPDEVIAHTSLFTLMAPNESVHIQELAHGFLEDMMAKGFDPRKKYDPDDLAEWEYEFQNMAQGQHIPAYMHDHFMSQASGIWRKPRADEIESGTYKSGMHTASKLESPDQPLRSAVGKTGSASQPDKPGKWNTVARYHEVHGLFGELLGKHGVDSDAIMNELSAMKVKNSKFAFGFGQKTFRYTLGMLGLGKNVVPDTHFVRHIFGMHPEDPNLDKLKSWVGSGPEKEPMLQGIDKWFRANHPAFEWTRNKLKTQYGEDFGDHATFPAFWLHWTTIAPHERDAKWNVSQASNEGTDHAVLWNSVHHILDQYGLPHDPHHPSLRKKEAWSHGGSLSARTAHAMKSIQDRFGETAASIAYYAYLAPLLMAPSKPEALHKAEVMARLLKGEHEEESAAAPKTYMHKGHAVLPGEVEFIGGPQQGTRLPLVSIGKDYHHVLSPEGGLMKLQAGHPMTRIVKQPKLVRANTQVDSKMHGHPTLHGTNDQHDLIHGIDMAKMLGRVSPKPGLTSRLMPEGSTGWFQSGEGHLAYVKPSFDAQDDDEAYGNPNFGIAHREAAFSRLAHEFFGLGDNVPVSTVFKHPVTGEWHSAQKHVEGEHYSRGSMYHKEMLGQLARSGQLDKLGLMDMLLHQTDRHSGNGLFSADGGKLQLIDNGQAFSKHKEYQPKLSDFWAIGHEYNDGDNWYVNPLHPGAVAWLQGLDPQKMAEHMDRLGVPKEERDESVRRLVATQKRVGRGNVSRGAAMGAPFMTQRREPPAARIHFMDGV